MSKKMGRPRLPARDVRGEVIMLRLRSDEKRAIMRAARKSGEPCAVWMRELLLRAARRVGGSASR